MIAEAMARPDITVATVCGGSLALDMAGLLEGRTAVTHVLGMDVLEAAGVRTVDSQVVDDGDLVNAGGVTSGLGLGLHLLERSFGPRIAHAVEQLFPVRTPRHRVARRRPDPGRRMTEPIRDLVGSWALTIATPIGRLPSPSNSTPQRGPCTGPPPAAATRFPSAISSPPANRGSSTHWLQTATRPCTSTSSPPIP
jgi:hypothetical protein